MTHGQVHGYAAHQLWAAAAVPFRASHARQAPITDAEHERAGQARTARRGKSQPVRQ
ncbi:hypothetical protein SCOCK_290067 [Actinacidiphila cocklensis]|uniref:Uncharacterized protein n=1 Tax=Actinacidiphila cocklensis TaxID=887465 RepID=A0A9W4GRI6_9ACTN|nr:hypothetical protein SCOCK_290067 [Actinacidiphila cocklensis]